MLDNKGLLSFLLDEYLIILSQVKQLRQEELSFFFCPLTTELLDKTGLLTVPLFKKHEPNCVFKVVKTKRKVISYYSLRLST